MSTKNRSKRKKLWGKSPYCHLCGFLIPTFEDSSVDHIIPRSLGGDNHWPNLALAHIKCNVKRGIAPVETIRDLGRCTEPSHPITCVGHFVEI